VLKSVNGYYPHTAAPDGDGCSDAIAAIGHELRTPLAALRVMTEVLSDFPALSSQEGLPLLRRLDRTVTWMEGIVERLDVWGALESGRLQPQLVPVSLRSVVERALDLDAPAREKREQRVRLICPEPSPLVRGDTHLLVHAVLNLLANANRHAPAGDELEVTVALVAAHDAGPASADTWSWSTGEGESASAERWAEVRVTDHGPGVPVPEQQRIFDRYYRGAGAYPGAGLGLGLYIAQRLVSVHGGTLGVESAPGQGATFSFRLPALASNSVDERTL
jgi:signal transduction histidine kinase